jgi:hypothetical protein
MRAILLCCAQCSYFSERHGVGIISSIRRLPPNVSGDEVRGFIAIEEMPPYSV